MVIAVGFVIGAALGWWRATQRQGKRLDKLQYAAGFGIFFAILAFVFTIVAVRMGWG